MRLLLAALIDGTLVGAIYCVAGLTISVGYRPSRVLNLAQGQFFMLGGLAAAKWAPRHNDQFTVLGVVAALALGALVGLVAGVGLRYLVFAVERLSTEIEVVVATFGGLYILEGASGLVWGVDPVNAPNFPGSNSIVLTTGVGIPGQAWYVVGYAVVCYVVVRLLLGAHGFGVRLKATGYDPDIARAFGVNTSRVILGGYALAGVLGGIGGAIFVPILSASFSGGTNLALYAVIAAVAGGLERPAGAIIAGLMIGLAGSLGAAYLGGQYGEIVALSLLVLILFVRPQGMLVPKQRIALR